MESFACREGALNELTRLLKSRRRAPLSISLSLARAKVFNLGAPT